VCFIDPVQERILENYRDVGQVEIVPYSIRSYARVVDLFWSALHFSELLTHRNSIQHTNKLLAQSLRPFNRIMRRRQVRIISPIIQPRNLIKEDPLDRHLGIVVDRAPVRIRINLLDDLIYALACVICGYVSKCSNIRISFQFRNFGDVGRFWFGVQAWP
jgi:hypothetical protein